MHRVSVFRDDVVFVIYIGQRWIYPIDRTRPAEAFDDDDDTRSSAAAIAGAADIPVDATSRDIPAAVDAVADTALPERASGTPVVRRRG